MLNPELLAAYRWHKARLVAHWRPTRGGLRSVPTTLARAALEFARADVAAGKRRYPRSTRYSAAGAPFAGYGTRGMRWCESPADVGLRFVGYADKLAKIDHTGWWTDDDGASESIRGVVYQLPARNGRPVYVSGYEDPNNGAADANGPAAVDFGTLWYGERGGENADSDHFGEHRAAAYHADKLAERMAEQEREYQTAWQAGSLYADTKSELADDRATLRRLLAERRAAKAAGAAYPTICATIERAIRNALADIRAGRETLEQLARGDYSRGDYYLGFYTGDKRLRDAFNDGAGAAVLP